MRKLNESGQIILVLLLTMLVALSIGLVVTTRSISDVKSSTQTEQAARAFSAAEAGIEEAAQRGSAGTSPLSLGNDASAIVDTKFLPDSATFNYAIEYPPIGKKNIAQFWLANPDIDPDAATGNSYYTNTTVNAYFGNSTSFASDDEKPALALTFINYDPTAKAYSSYKVYLDSVSSRASINSFTLASCTSPGAINTTMSTGSQFLCSAAVAIKKDKTGVADCNAASSCVPMLVRARVLYSSTDQKIALQPTPTCPNGSNPTCFPPQVSLFKSTGTAGQSQKTIQVFRLKKVVPAWFDYAIFSAGDITK